MIVMILITAVVDLNISISWVYFQNPITVERDQIAMTSRESPGHGLEIRQLPGQKIPMVFDNVPMRQELSGDFSSSINDDDTRPMHTSSVNSHSNSLDTPSRVFAHTAMYPSSSTQGYPSMPYDSPSQNFSMLDTPMRDSLPSQHYQPQQWDGTSVRHMGGPLASPYDTPMQQPYQVPSSQNISMMHGSPSMQGTPTRHAPMTSSYGRNMTAVLPDNPYNVTATVSGQSAMNASLLASHGDAYGYTLVDTPMRHLPDAAMPHFSSHPISANHTAAHLSNLPSSSVPDTPLRDMMRSLDSSHTFYSPPYPPKSPPERDTVCTRASVLSPTAIKQEPHAISRHGTADAHPHASSRHGTLGVLDSPLDLSSSTKSSVKTPYALSEETTPSPTKPYKLNTPYGTADNEISNAPSSISLTNAMDVIRNSMIQHQPEPTSVSLAFGTLPQMSPIMTPAVQRQSNGVSLTTQQHQSPVLQPTSSDNVNDIENALNQIGVPNMESVQAVSDAAIPTPVKMEFSMDSPKLKKQMSQESDDKASLNSFGSGMI